MYDINATQEEIVNIFIENVIGAQDKARLDWQGGYACEYKTLGEYIVVATVDYNGAPELNLYSIPEVIKWYRELLDSVRFDDSGLDAYGEGLYYHWMEHGKK